MAKREPVRVFEYERLYNEKRKGGRLTIPQFEALVKYNQEHDNRFFTVIHQGIQFKQYVGVIQVGGLTIEVLPKADREAATDEARQRWHDVLFQMLRVCQRIRLEGSTDADLRLRHATLLDLYIDLFLVEVEQLLHRGLSRQYHAVESNRTALTGRLEFQRHITRNLVHKERFYVRHQVYDREHLLHQILQEALMLIPNLSGSPDLSDKVGRLLLDFPDLPRRKVSQKLFDQLSYNRKTEHYSEAIQLARLLLLNYSPDIRHGRNNVLAILFDMNELFEEYIFRQVRRAAPADVKVRSQVGKQFWEYKRIRPDIVIEKEGLTYVLDTKWKVLKDLKPADADLKQMYVYHHYLGAQKTILLYPNVYDLSSRKGKYHMPKESGLECHMQFVNVLTEDGKLNEWVGEEVLRMLGGEFIFPLNAGS